MQAVTSPLPTGHQATTMIRLSTAGDAPKTGVSIVQNEPQLIAAILPQVLARYGLSEIAQSQESQPPEVDLLA